MRSQEREVSDDQRIEFRRRTDAVPKPELGGGFFFGWRSPHPVVLNPAAALLRTRLDQPAFVFPLFENSARGAFEDKEVNRCLRRDRPVAQAKDQRLLPHLERLVVELLCKHRR